MRILFDTDELRSLGSFYESGAGAIGNIRASTAAGAAGLVLNMDDPVIRGARIQERQHRLSDDLNRLTNEYRSDATRFRSLADNLEGEQGGSMPSWLLTMPMWGALAGGGVGGVLLAGGVVSHTGLSSAGEVADGIRRLFGGFQRGAAAVGRSALDGALGLAGEAQSWLDAARSQADRLRQMAQEAWNGIWDRVSSLFRHVQVQLSQLVQRTGAALRSARQVMTQVARAAWQSEELGFVLALYSALTPGGLHFVTEGQYRVLRGEGPGWTEVVLDLTTNLPDVGGIPVGAAFDWTYEGQIGRYEDQHVLPGIIRRGDGEALRTFVEHRMRRVGLLVLRTGVGAIPFVGAITGPIGGVVFDPDPEPVY